jgi:hypothetical protein
VNSDLLGDLIFFETIRWWGDTMPWGTTHAAWRERQT